MQTVVCRPDKGKPFPMAKEPEKAILGILLFRPDYLRLIIERDLQPGHFLAPHHEVVYQAILSLDRDGEPIEPNSVYARMAAQCTDGSLAAHGGIAYLLGLQNDCEGTGGLADHVSAVKLAHIERRQALIREELQRDLSAERRQALGQELSTLTVEHDALLCAAVGWPGDPSPPTPLDAENPPAWPDDVLPSTIAEYVDAVAESNQVPHDLAGMIALGTLSACWLGKVCALHPSAHEEQLSLYCIAGADVGERKSSTYAKLETPIRRYEAERRAAIEPQRSAYRADHAGLDAELQRAIKLRQRFEPGSDDYLNACDTARRLSQDLDKLRPPPRAEFLTQDCTPEGLARLMSETGGFAALLSPEGGGVFDILRGRYSDTPNLDVFLKSYDGERLVIHRASREREVPPIERPALAIAVTTQPATLRKLTERQELDERGLVARFLFSVPAHSFVGYRQASRPAVLDSLADAYAQTLLTALRVERPEQPHTLRMSSEATADYEALFYRIEPRLRPDGDLHPMRGWACKLLGKIVRIAALIHLTEGCRRHPEPWTIPLSGEAFRRASRLTEYLIAHARRAFCLMRQSPHIERARKLLSGLAQEHKALFTLRDAHRIINRNTDAESIRPVLELLAAHNYIARTEGRRRDSERWQVNPRAVRSWPSPKAKPPGKPGQ